MDPTTLPIFPTSTLTVACTSDTHNETPDIPPADILIHAGDLTDRGTPSELSAAYTWLASLPHRLKIVIPGNNDRGLCPTHSRYSPESHTLFTSATAQTRDRIVYLAHETRTVAQYTTNSGALRPLKVYANPSNPDHLAGAGAAGTFENPWGFAFLPRPDPAADEAWKGAPVEDAAQIWVTHTPPLGRLDYSPCEIDPKTGGQVLIGGCEVLAEKLGVARPRLNVFGHLHGGSGVEVVQWEQDEKAEVVAVQNDEVGSAKGSEVLDFAASKEGQRTVFVNAAWMPLRRIVNHRRNVPWLIKIDLER